MNLVEKFEITLRPVPGVDNQGEQCPMCDREFAPVEAQIYYRDKETGEDRMEDSCLPCLVESVRYAANRTERTITVEIGEKGYEDRI